MQSVQQLGQYAIRMNRAVRISAPGAFLVTVTVQLVCEQALIYPCVRADL